jgi:hypothetical protein
LKQKDQDFAISRRLYLKASHFESFEKSIVKETNIAYLACECRTNPDKTMFQEASATALDLKSSVPSSLRFALRLNSYSGRNDKA